MSPPTYSSAPLLILPLLVDVPHLTSVERNTTFNYFGPVSSPLVSRAAHFLRSNIDAVDETSLTATLQSFLQASYADCVGNADEKSCCWFTISLTKPHSGFDVLRWPHVHVK